jgi:hypothetical protein
MRSLRRARRSVNHSSDSDRTADRENPTGDTTSRSQSTCSQARWDSRAIADRRRVRVERSEPLAVAMGFARSCENGASLEKEWRG